MSPFMLTATPVAKATSIPNFLLLLSLSPFHYRTWNDQVSTFPGSSTREASHRAQICSKRCSSNLLREDRPGKAFGFLVREADTAVLASSLPPSNLSALKVSVMPDSGHLVTKRQQVYCKAHPDTVKLLSQLQQLSASLALCYMSH